MPSFNVRKYTKLYLSGVISLLDFHRFRKMYLRRYRTKVIRHSICQFKLEQYSEDECDLLFRFKKFEILKLVTLLGIPNTIKIKGSTFRGTEIFCLLLRRLSYPNRLSDLVKIFHRDISTLSRGINWILKWIMKHHAHKLTSLECTWLTDGRKETYLKKCLKAGSPYPNVIGFIDGTARPICRPKYNQKLQYSGYKKLHLIKYQSVVFPDGIIGRLDGPFNGNRHDSAILHISCLKNELRKIFVVRNRQYALFGDVGYSNQRFIKVGFKNYKILTDKQKSFNTEISALRVNVEYGFGRILKQFAYLDFKKTQQLHLQNLRLQYFVAAFLINCQSCMRGNQTSQYFNCCPPELVDYLQ